MSAMPKHSSLDDSSFRRILSRNITLPLSAGVISAGVFVALLVYLVTVMNWVEHSERVIGTANEITKQMVDMETGLRGYMLAGEESFLEPYVLSKPKVVSNFKTLEELVADNPEQVARVHQIEAQHAQWNVYAQEMIKLRAANDDVLGPVKTGRGKTQFDEIRRLVDTFVNVEQRLRSERNATAKLVTIWVAVVYLILTLGVGGALAYFGRREILDLSRTYDDALRKQHEHNEQLQEQAWLRAGQTALAEQGVGQLALPLLAATVLQFIARYLGAAVGALYVREPDGSLRRAAAYGFSDEWQRREQTLAPAEGLVGQAALENRLIRLDDVPGDYIKVNSGLGAGTPHSVALLPVDSDGTVNGVMELGFVRPLSERDIDFLKLVAGNIGTAVEATLARQRLQEAFAETQQLNEELQVQQEELRTANEELEEQSRVLEESQVSLENQKAELEQTNEQLSSQAVALADQRDALDRNNADLNVAQIELEARAEELQRSSKYKSEFLANMSHELRTPLNSSLILAKLLAENPAQNLTGEQVKFAESIYSAGNDLLNLINDILDISKVEAGKLDMRPENSSVARLVEGLLGMFQPLAADKKLEFHVELQAGAPTMLFTDRQRLEQILKNLLSNAIKFTETGTVSMTVSRQPGEGIAFTVRDSGIGIAEEQQESIFEAFRQADGTTNRRYGGTGLGLSISRDLAKLLGGSISVTSAPGQGIIFTLVLPEQYVEQAQLEYGEI